MKAIKRQLIPQLETQARAVAGARQDSNSVPGQDSRPKVAATGAVQRRRARRNSRAEVITGKMGTPNLHPVQTQRRKRRP